MLLITLMMALIGMAVYVVYAIKNGFHGGLTAIWLTGILMMGISVFRCGVALQLPATWCFAAGLAMFIYQVYGTYVDYFNGVSFFGDVSQIGLITGTLSALFLTAVLSAISCFSGRKS